MNLNRRNSTDEHALTAGPSLERLQKERAAIVKALGVVDNESLNLPALISTMNVRIQSQKALLLKISGYLKDVITAIEVIS